MACCTEYQTECLRVVTVGYLRSFVNGEIHSSSNDSEMSISHANGDTYCPTYAELTGGTLVQNFKSDSDPQGYVDGIIVSGSYANNQLVRQQDLSLKYTRFGDITISASKTRLRACGDESSTLSYTYTFNVTTKGMNSSCTVTSSTSSESSSRTSYELDGDNSAFSLAGSTVSVPKNDDGGNPRWDVPERCTDAYVKASWRRYNYSKFVTICQDKLTGDYTYDSGRTYYNVVVTAGSSSGGGSGSCTITGGTSSVPSNGGTYTLGVDNGTCSGGGAGGSTTCDCYGGTFYASATGYYYNRWCWVDSCGTIYRQAPFDDVYGQEDADDYLNAPSKTFYSWDCCDGNGNDSFTFKVNNYHGISSNEVTVKRSCSSCAPCTPPCPTCAKIIDNYDECDSSYVHVEDWDDTSDSDTIQVPDYDKVSVSSTGGFVKSATRVGDQIKFTFDKNTGSSDRTGSITVSYSGSGSKDGLPYCSSNTMPLKQKGKP